MPEDSPWRVVWDALTHSPETRRVLGQALVRPDVLHRFAKLVAVWGGIAVIAVVACRPIDAHKQAEYEANVAREMYRRKMKFPR